MPDYGGPGGFQGSGAAGNPGGFGGSGGGNRPSVQNRPNMLDIAGPVTSPATSTTTSPNQGSDNQMGIVNPAVMDLALTPSLNIFNQGAGGIEMSTAAVAAAPETIPEETNPLINFFNKRIVNPYVDAVYNYGLPLSQFTPTQFGLISLYGNMFNFNPTKDEETGEISTSNLGEVGTATFGKLNLDNYIGAEEVNPQDFYGAAFDFDDEGNFEGTNFEKLEKFTEEEGLSLKPGMDLEQNLIDNMEFGGDGPQKQFVPPSTSLAEEGAASATDPQQPAPTTPTDAVNLDAVYSGLSDAEKATVDKIVEMDDYDLPYALTYVLYGGPLF